MKPKTQDATAFELFQAHFNQILNPEYSLVRLMENNPYDGLRTASRLADSPAAQVGLFQGRPITFRTSSSVSGIVARMLAMCSPARPSP